MYENSGVLPPPPPLPPPPSQLPTPRSMLACTSKIVPVAPSSATSSAVVPVTSAAVASPASSAVAVLGVVAVASASLSEPDSASPSALPLPLPPPFEPPHANAHALTAAIQCFPAMRRPRKPSRPPYHHRPDPLACVDPGARDPSPCVPLDRRPWTGDPRARSRARARAVWDGARALHNGPSDA